MLLRARAPCPAPAAACARCAPRLRAAAAAGRRTRRRGTAGGPSPPPADGGADEPGRPPPPSPPDAATSAALSLLALYKAAVSPLLPRSCRFLPTCSSYGVEALRCYGFGAGVLLLAWRLLRCNPLNGEGVLYDPPRDWAQRLGLQPR